MKKYGIFMLNTICLIMIFTKPVYAYIDPATTSYVIQIVAGVVIACGAALSIFWNKISRALRKKKNADEEAPVNKADASDDNGKKKVITADDLLDDDR